MANLNRLKVVLVEHGKTGKWLANELNKLDIDKRDLLTPSQRD